MKVAILNYDGVVPTSITGPFDMLDKVGIISKSLNVPAKTLFEVDIINTPSALASKDVSDVMGNKTLADNETYDLVIISAMNFNRIQETLQNETAMIEWIAGQHKKGSEIAGICLGTFVLAATGLLDGKRATTHWMGVPYFREFFPNVQLEDDKVIIDEGRIYTCGAAYSFTSLMIYLIEKFSGRDISLAAAKVFMIQVHDAPQHAFSIFNLQHTHSDKDISNVQRFIESNYKDKLGVSDLAGKFNMSQRTFIRKFTDTTGNTPLEYIQRVRVEAAKRLLEKGKLSVEEVCRQAGYEDFNSFRNVFKRFAGITPQEYKRKYGQMFRQAVVG